MCKRDTESVKMAPESVLSNRVESRRYALDRRGFAPGEVFAEGVISGGLSLGGLSSYTVRSTSVHLKLDVIEQVQSTVSCRSTGTETTRQKLYFSEFALFLYNIDYRKLN